MSDLTPPPDEPMPDQARSRIRADLLAAAQADRQPGPRRWVVPMAAAAAVLVVGGVAGWAVQAGDGGDSGGPAGGGASSEAPTASPQPTESDTAGESQQVDVKQQSCAEAVAETLPGATRAAAFDEDGTSFWVRGDRFTLCDDRAGTTTVHHPLPMQPVEDVSTYAVSSVNPPWPHSTAVIRVAGGIVPPGATAFDVRYRFPTGATGRSETVTDDEGRTWWRMLAAYEAGRGNELDQPPITATVSYSGVQHTYHLRWGVDTCAQANHGC